MCFGPSDNPFEVSWANLDRRVPAFVLIDRRGSYEKTSQAARLVDSPLTFSPPQPRRSTRWVRTTVVGVGNRCSLSRGKRSFGHQGRGANNRQDGLPEIGREQRPGGDHLGQFFMSESQRLTIGVIGPLPGYSRVLEHVP